MHDWSWLLIPHIRVSSNRHTSVVDSDDVYAFGIQFFQKRWVVGGHDQLSDDGDHIV